jgi:hypothetical protein
MKQEVILQQRFQQHPHHLKPVPQPESLQPFAAPLSLAL